MLAKLLLPMASLRLDDVAMSERTVMVTVASTSQQAECPSCGQVCHRGHSQYTRTLRDLPVSGQCVQLRLQVRRFFCDNPLCVRKTFTERLPDFAPKSARRTKRLAELQTVIGRALGGEAGARLVRHLAMPTSPDTLLRITRWQPPQAAATPRVLGIDDWAWKKGRQYGTILVDLERHRPVELLPDRTAETLAAWLHAHPGVEIISRDRSGAYAQGATQGAPKAVQVADRWHLLTNLREAIQRLLDRHHRSLPVLRPEPATAGQPAPAPSIVAPETPALAPPAAAQPPHTQAARLHQERRARRLERFNQVVTLRQRGVSIRAIAQQVGVARATVYRYLAADSFPELAKRQPAPSILDPWAPYLRQRWDAGCHNGSRLWREIQAQGYRGSRGPLSDWVAARRKTLPPPTATAEAGSPHAPAPVTGRRLSARQAAWLVVKPPHALTGAEEEALTTMCQAQADIEQAYTLAQSFGQMVRERQCQVFDSWIASAQATEIDELKSFAAHLRRDKRAVVAALALPWSNGQVEGQVNRLKLIKRTMYGRASFDLLRQRVLDTS